MNTTGNIAADMISACLEHYKKRNKSVNRIRLSHQYWTIFKGYIKERFPELPIEDVVDFRNVRIEKGTFFQMTSLKADTFQKMASV